VNENNDPDEGEHGRLLLRVTARCLDEDLDETTVADAEAPRRRDRTWTRPKVRFDATAEPQGVEKVQPLQNASDVYTLRAGRWRGATWHDSGNNAVWLLAGRLHRSGAPDDAYPYFKHLDAEGRLLPTEHDYELLLPAQARSFGDDVIDRLPSALDEARTRSPAEVEVIVGTIPISSPS
jgi:hypothetical protein